MSKNYKGLGSLQYIVTEENFKKHRGIVTEAGQYFGDHTYSDRNTKKIDIDFQTSHNSKSNSNAKIEDPMLKKSLKKTVDKEIDSQKDDIHAFVDDDLYSKKKTQGKSELQNDDDINKNIDMKVYGENWYKTLSDYMKRV